MKNQTKKFWVELRFKTNENLSSRKTEQTTDGIFRRAGK